MFCYVDRYFVILFRLLHFLFQRDLVSRTHRLYIYNLITDYIIYVYMRYICLCIHTHICIYMYICAVIPHTALLSHSKLSQGKFLHRDSPSCSLELSQILLMNMGGACKIIINHGPFNSVEICESFFRIPCVCCRVIKLIERLCRVQLSPWTPPPPPVIKSSIFHQATARFVFQIKARSWHLLHLCWE